MKNSDSTLKNGINNDGIDLYDCFEQYHFVNSLVDFKEPMNDDNFSGEPLPALYKKNSQIPLLSDNGSSSRFRW